MALYDILIRDTYCTSMMLVCTVRSLLYVKIYNWTHCIRGRPGQQSLVHRRVASRGEGGGGGAILWVGNGYCISGILVYWHKETSGAV